MVAWLCLWFQLFELISLVICYVLRLFLGPKAPSLTRGLPVKTGLHGRRATRHAWHVINSWLLVFVCNSSYFILLVWSLFCLQVVTVEMNLVVAQFVVDIWWIDLNALKRWFCYFDFSKVFFIFQNENNTKY